MVMMVVVMPAVALPLREALELLVRRLGSPIELQKARAVTEGATDGCRGRWIAPVVPEDAVDLPLPALLQRDLEGLLQQPGLTARSLGQRELVGRGAPANLGQPQLLLLGAALLQRLVGLRDPLLEILDRRRVRMQGGGIEVLLDLPYLEELLQESLRLHLLLLRIAAESGEDDLGVLVGLVNRLVRGLDELPVGLRGVFDLLHIRLPRLGEVLREVRLVPDLPRLDRLLRQVRVIAPELPPGLVALDRAHQEALPGPLRLSLERRRPSEWGVGGPLWGEEHGERRRDAIFREGGDLRIGPVEDTLLWLDRPPVQEHAHRLDLDVVHLLEIRVVERPRRNDGDKVLRDLGRACRRRH